MSRVPTPKQRLRAAMKRTVESVPTRERTLASERVHELLLALPEWTDASIVLLYHAMPDEVDTHETILAALASQKRVYLPRVAAGKMGFHRLVDELSVARLARHPYGMLEPDGSATPWDAGEAHRTLVVCPGRAFDLAGNRLGRGGAFYDRFLRELRRGPAEAGRRPDTPADPVALAATPVPAPRLVIGICFDLQIVDAVPVTAGDEPVDAFVTDRRVVRV